MLEGAVALGRCVVAAAPQVRDEAGIAARGEVAGKAEFELADAAKVGTRITVPRAAPPVPT
jgi:hypothetical protein